MKGLIVLEGGDRPVRSIPWNGQPPERYYVPLDLPSPGLRDEPAPSARLWQVCYRLDRVASMRDNWVGYYQYEGVA